LILGAQNLYELIANAPGGEVALKKANDHWAEIFLSGSDRRQRCAIGVRLDPEQRRCQRVMTRGLHLRSGACACNTVASPATRWQAGSCSRQIGAVRGGVMADRRRERARRGAGSAGDRAGPAETMRRPSGLNAAGPDPAALERRSSE
jgi:hypothetical protein